MNKRDLRSRISARRARVTPEWVCEHSAAILRRTVELEAFGCARCMACYVSVGREVDTHGLIGVALAEGKQVGAPVTRAGGQMVFLGIASLEGFHTGRFGLLEPKLDAASAIAPEAFDVVIVPGVAFDRTGHRVGRGGGYYDRFLGLTDATRIGLAFGFQVVDAVPVEPHDMRVDVIVTESEVIVCR